MNKQRPMTHQALGEVLLTIADELRDRHPGFEPVLDPPRDSDGDSAEP